MNDSVTVLKWPANSVDLTKPYDVENSWDVKRKIMQRSTSELKPVLKKFGFFYQEFSWLIETIIDAT